MNFQIINDDYFEKILHRLKDIVPEFVSVFEDDDGAYPILGEFGEYLISNIRNEPVLEKGIRFINEAIELGGSDTENIIVLQLFQKFYEDTFVSVKIRSALTIKSQILFDKYREA